MNPDQFELERRLQAAAERSTTGPDNATVARHRYVLHAIRQLEVPQLPSGFAQQIDERCNDYPEEAAAEQWLLRLMIAVVIVLAVAALWPWLVSSVAALSASSGTIPWRFLSAVLIGLISFALVDARRTMRMADRS